MSRYTTTVGSKSTRSHDFRIIKEVWPDGSHWDWLCSWEWKRPDETYWHTAESWPEENRRPVPSGIRAWIETVLPPGSVPAHLVPKV